MLYDFLSSNYPISIVILALSAAWAYRNRSSIRLAAVQDRAPWNIIGKIAVASTVLFFLWVTVLDNWRQLLGYVVITGRDYGADPFESGATPDAVRMVSVALLVAAVITLGLLYARHMGSYVFLLMTMVLAPIYMLAFNEIRISADVFLRLSEMSLERGPSLLDLSFIMFWSAGMFILIGTVVLAAFLSLVAWIAFPMRLIYGMFAAPRQEELADIFESYERRARQAREQQPGHQGNGGLNQDVPVES